MTLRYTLVVRHPETQEAVALRAGGPVPDWAKGLVHKDDLEPAEPRTSRRKSTDS